jgi:hypothetical protein
MLYVAIRSSSSQPLDGDSLIAKKRKIFSINPRQLPKLDEIYPAFAKFALRYKRMRFAKPLRDLHLGEVSLASRLDQSGEKSLVCLVITLIVGIHLRMYSQS